MSVHKKNQPNRSSRLAGYREHIYECLVLWYKLLVGILMMLTLSFEIKIWSVLHETMQGPSLMNKRGN